MRLWRQERESDAVKKGGKIMIGMNLKKWNCIPYALAAALVLSVPGMGGLGIGTVRAAQAPTEEEQKAMFSKGILDVGAYGYNVPDGYGWGPGADNIPMRCTLRSGGRVLVEVRENDDAGKTFFSDFGQQKNTLEEFAHKEFGPELTEIAFDTQQTATSRTMPVIRITVLRNSHILKATFCYRQEDTYTAEFIGINDCNDDSLDAATVSAAQSFTDFGGPAHMRSVRPEVPLGDAQWPYPYFHNPFAVAKSYFDDTFPPPPPPSRQSTDYDLNFSSVAIEAVVRRYLNNDNFSVPLRSSNLDAFTYFKLEENEDTQMYAATLNDSGTSFPTFDTTVDSLQDLKEFRNLTGIWLDLPNVSDFSPLGQLDKLESMLIMPGAGMKDVNWMSNLTNLRQVTLWGGEFPEITDISPMKSLTKLESLTMGIPSVKDVSVLAQLPGLNSVILMVSKDADLKPLLDAPQIKTLYVNGEKMKGE